MNNKEKLKQFLYKNKTFLNARATEKCLENNGLSEVLAELITETKFAEDSLTLKQRMIVYCNDICYQNKCANCKKELLVLSGSSWKECCSMKCAQNLPKNKEKMLEGQSKVDWSSVIEKRKCKLLETKGVEHISQLQENRDKLSERSKSMWKNNSEDLIEKRKKTLKTNYGVLHNMQIPNVADNVSKKRKETLKNKSSQEIEKSKQKMRITKIGEFRYNNLSFDNLDFLYNVCEFTIADICKELEERSDVVQLALENHGFVLDLKRENKNKSGSSREYELFKFIEEIIPEETILVGRRIVANKEIDIYIPERNIGIEFNGVYWHSELKVPKDYHKMKSEIYAEAGIQIIQIWEDDWLNKKEVVKNFLKNKFGKTKRIGARKTKIIELTQKQFDDFVNSNHMQGSNSLCSTRLGLIEDNGEIVSAIGFTKKKNSVFELSRFANKNVSGSFSKLLQHFIKINNPTEIISFADLEIVNRNYNIYTKFGFAELAIISPDYKYYNKSTKKREHKFSWRKSKFEILGFDIENKTEKELAKEAGLLRCFDSGKIKYSLKP